MKNRLKLIGKTLSGFSATRWMCITYISIPFTYFITLPAAFMLVRKQILNIKLAQTSKVKRNWGLALTFVSLSIISYITLIVLLLNFARLSSSYQSSVNAEQYLNVSGIIFVLSILAGVITTVRADLQYLKASKISRDKNLPVTQ